MHAHVVGFDVVGEVPVWVGSPKQEGVSLRVFSNLMRTHEYRDVLTHKQLSFYGNYCSLCCWPKCEHIESSTDFPSKHNFCNLFQISAMKSIQNSISFTP
jgi:hypothetical protein